MYPCAPWCSNIFLFGILFGEWVVSSLRIFVSPGARRLFSVSISSIKREELQAAPHFFFLLLIQNLPKVIIARETQLCVLGLHIEYQKSSKILLSKWGHNSPQLQMIFKGLRHGFKVDWISWDGKVRSWVIYCVRERRGGENYVGGTSTHLSCCA